MEMNSNCIVILREYCDVSIMWVRWQIEYIGGFLFYFSSSRIYLLGTHQYSNCLDRSVVPNSGNSIFGNDDTESHQAPTRNCFYGAFLASGISIAVPPDRE
jgi:hypothetical protein